MGVKKRELCTYTCEACRREWEVEAGKKPTDMQMTGRIVFSYVRTETEHTKSWTETKLENFWLCDRCSKFQDNFFAGNVEVTDETMYKMGDEFFNRTWVEYCAMKEYIEGLYNREDFIDSITAAYKKKYDIKDY